jgi:hypothetical protein
MSTGRQATEGVKFLHVGRLRAEEQRRGLEGCLVAHHV